MVHVIIDTFKEAFRITRKRHAEQRAAAERRRIAKVFNDLYTYRERFDKSKSDRLPGSGMYGFTPEVGHAWMCPDCNKIHHATSCSAFSGLQYPACCSYPEGHRLYHDIKTRA